MTAIAPKRRPGPSSPAYDFWTCNRLLENSIDDPRTGCRIWLGHVNKPGGYGRIGYRYRLWRAHRLAYTLLMGPIPEGLDLLHSCDNPRCINPNHLRPGTHAENIAEAYARGRKRVASGADHHNAKLTQEQAQEIIESREPTPELAARLGISRHTVWRIRSGKAWRSLDRSKA